MSDVLNRSDGLDNWVVYCLHLTMNCVHTDMRTPVQIGVPMSLHIA